MVRGHETKKFHEDLLACNLKKLLYIFYVKNKQHVCTVVKVKIHLNGGSVANP
jgi:hypothetical protein